MLVIDADFEAHGLKKGKLDKLDVVADLDYKARRLTAKLDVHLRDAPLLTVKAEAPFDVERIVAGKPWRQTPISVDAEVPRYPLHKLADLMPKLDGRLAVKAAVRGTVAHPTATLDGNIDALQLGAMKYDRFVIKGELRRRRDHGQGRRARSKKWRHAGVERDAAARCQRGAAGGSLKANGFYLDIEDLDLTNPRLVKGTLSLPRSTSTGRAPLPDCSGRAALQRRQARAHCSIRRIATIVHRRSTCSSATTSSGAASVSRRICRAARSKANGSGHARRDAAAQRRPSTRPTPRSSPSSRARSACGSTPTSPCTDRATPRA